MCPRWFQPPFESGERDKRKEERSERERERDAKYLCTLVTFLFGTLFLKINTIQ